MYWGDRTAEVASTAVSHTYAAGGQYEIGWRGTGFMSWGVSTTETSNQKLIDVVKWGSNGAIAAFNVFQNCDNLASFTATDVPLRVRPPATQTSFIRVFDNCAIWNGDLSNWDLSAATTFQEFFRS